MGDTLQPETPLYDTSPAGQIGVSSSPNAADVPSSALQGGVADQSTALQGGVEQQSTALQGSVDQSFSPDDSDTPTQSCPISLPTIPQVNPPPSKPPARKPLQGNVVQNQPYTPPQTPWVFKAMTPTLDTTPTQPPTKLTGGVSQTKLITGISQTTLKGGISKTVRVKKTKKIKKTTTTKRRTPDSKLVSDKGKLDEEKKEGIEVEGPRLKGDVERERHEVGDKEKPKIKGSVGVNWDKVGGEFGRGSKFEASLSSGVTKEKGGYSASLIKGDVNIAVRQAEAKQKFGENIEAKESVEVLSGHGSVNVGAVNSDDEHWAGAEVGGEIDVIKGKGEGKIEIPIGNRVLILGGEGEAGVGVGGKVKFGGGWTKEEGYQAGGKVKWAFGPSVGLGWSIGFK